MSALGKKPPEQSIDHSACPSDYWYIDSKQRDETILVIVGFLQNPVEEAINLFQGHCKRSVHLEEESGSSS